MNYSDYNIEIAPGRTTGEFATKCPNCSHTRKKQSVKCLQVNLDKGVWNCKHCGWTGGLKPEKAEIIYTLPEWENKTDLSEKVVKYFEGRRISQETLTTARVTETTTFFPQLNAEAKCICFNYFHDGVLKNIKYRDGQKNFKLHKGAELILYNIDAVKDKSEIWICEGEIDCLSLIECGLPAVSVPNGATLTGNNLSYLNNYIYLFEKVEKIHICTDNDPAGRELRNALADRFGRDRTNFVVFEGCKDANEYLVANGKIHLREAAQKFTEFPLEGVFTISDLSEDIFDLYNNGLPEGARTGMVDFDNLLRFEKGYLTTITGIPGHGKSDFLDQVLLKLHKSVGWKGAYYSPENRPISLHFAKLARKILGKSWLGRDKMTPDEVYTVMDLLDQNFWFIKPDKDFTLESILNSVKQLQAQKGIDWFVIDPWNKLEHKYEVAETKYIGESLDKITAFCERNNVHCFLVAHPTKIRKDKETGMFDIPNLYDIAGSANFFNKTDNGITVYRDMKEDRVNVYIQKVKFSHWGEIGYVNFHYSKSSGRYMATEDTFDSWI